MSERDTEYLHVLLRRSLRELERLEQGRLSRARARVRSAHISVLAALLDASPLKPGELGARCEIEPSTMTGLLRSLEKEGLIERRKVVLDQRSQSIFLTSRGRVASRAAVRARVAAQQAVLRGLSRDVAREMPPLLARLSAAAARAAGLQEAKAGGPEKEA